jgi:hypothetical protein
MLTWLQRDVSLTFSALERYSFEPIEGLNLVASWLEIYAGGFLPRADMLSPVNSTERNSQRFNTFAAKLDS